MSPPRDEQRLRRLASASELAASIRQGYEAKADDPDTCLDMPGNWLAAWLVSKVGPMSPLAG